MPTPGVRRLPGRVVAAAGLLCLCIIQVEAAEKSKTPVPAFRMPSANATLSQIDGPLPPKMRRPTSVAVPALPAGVKPVKMAPDLKIITGLIDCGAWTPCIVIGVVNVGGSPSTATILRQHFLSPCTHAGNCQEINTGSFKDWSIPALNPRGAGAGDPFYFPHWVSQWLCWCRERYVVDPLNTTVDADRSNNELMFDN